MKFTAKRILSLLLALVFVCSLAPAAFALGDDDWDDINWDDINWDDIDWGDDWDDSGSGSGSSSGSSRSSSSEIILVSLVSSLDMKVGESQYLFAEVTGDASTFTWSSSNSSVVSVSDYGAGADLSAKKAGSATITVTARSSGGGSDSATCRVTVTEDSSPVKVSGGGSVSMKVGDTKNLSASVSGGSGSYTYDWDFDGGVYSSDHMRGNATVEAIREGSGSAILTVYDADDHSNYDMAIWSFDVQGSPSTPPTVRIDKTSLSLEPGKTASLTMTASGGSGRFEYYWTSDNTAVASVSGSGSTATVTAASSLISGTKYAVISGVVQDSNGSFSDEVYCYVTVESKGGSGTYNPSASATVGSDMYMSAIGSSIASAWYSQFGSAVDYGATLYITSPSSSYGYMTLQDGAYLNSGSAYTYAHFDMMTFTPLKSGSFSSAYRLKDGSYEMSGTITISISGGTAISSVSLSPSSLKMDTYSAEWLYLNVSPSNASYDVTWSSSNRNIVEISGSGNNVTLISGGKTGSATVTASVRDNAGKTRTATCSVKVQEDRTGYIYNPTLTVTMGSDYYGTSTSTSMSNQFHSYYGYYLSDDATIVFSSTGNSRYGVQRLANGSAIVANRTYTFRDWIDAYFEPVSVGDFTLPYSISYRGYTMSGTFTIHIRGANVNASINPTSMRLSTYASQNVSVSVSGRYSRIYWSSTNTNIATVSGSGTTATVYANGTTGSATIRATIVDVNGIEVVKNCSVNVTNGTSSSTYNPSVTTTLGVPYTGTGTSDAMKNQFLSVYGLTLNESNATIRFSSVGNNSIAVLRMSDGAAARANTNYTFAQYRAMYTDPVSTGAFTFPYTLTYNNKTLSGTVTVNISGSNINASINLASNTNYLFSSASMSGATGASLLTSAINNAVGSSWSYIRFSSFSSNTGTLYQNSSMTSLTSATNVYSNALNNLYFVPGSMAGAYSASFTVYNGSNSSLGTGTLTITKAVTPFSDVPASQYYYDAVNWAVANGITAGTNTTLNTFSPANPVTRAEAVTFLWRVMGKPEPRTTANPFTDVSTADYFYKPVLWAVENGITLGTQPTQFSPNNSVTKIQMLSFIFRSRGGVVNIATWETDTVNWANNQGMLTGIPTIFVAGDSCPRSDVVYYLYRDSLLH